MYDLSEFKEVLYKLQEVMDNNKAKLILGKKGYSLQIDDDNRKYFEDSKHTNILSEALSFILPNLLRYGTDTIEGDLKEKADIVQKAMLNDERTKEYMFRILASDNIVDSFAFQTIIKPHLDNKYCSGLFVINYTDICDEEKSIKFEVDLKIIESIIKLLTEAKEELTKYKEEFLL